MNRRTRFVAVLVGTAFALMVPFSTVSAQAVANNDGARSPNGEPLAPLPSISDAQLGDCLTRIGEFEHPLPGAVSPTAAFEELSALKAELYFKYPDVQGFIHVPNDRQLTDDGQIAEVSVPVAAADWATFDSVWSEVSSIRSIRHLTTELRDSHGTVRELCGVFLDVLDSDELDGNALGAAIDQKENVVVIYAHDADSMSEYADAVYGRLARVEAGAEPAYESRDWSIGPFPAGQRIYVPGGASWCSLGFNMKNGSGTWFSMTAGHCAQISSVWHSAGYVGAISNYLSGTDVAFMYGGAYSNGIFRGAWNSNSTGQVLGILSALPNPGNYAGVSGATTGESRGPYVRSGCFNGQCNQLFFAGHTTAGGDSGSPWFAQLGSSADVLAVGIHSGWNGSSSSPMMRATDIRYIVWATQATFP
jgi:hypothetical protein